MPIDLLVHYLTLFTVDIRGYRQSPKYRSQFTHYPSEPFLQVFTVSRINWPAFLTQVEHRTP